MTTTYGNTWINTGLSSGSVFSLLSSENNLVAGMGNGVFISRNNGTNWVGKNEGFNTVPSINALLLANNYVFAGTSGQSVWRRPYSDVIGVKNISTAIPSAYSLSQNYPNPFNPRTVIRFQLSVVGLTALKIYDIMGREIQTLVNEKLQPGTYEATFDGSNLSSGTYFYKLTSGDFTMTKRLTLIK